MQVVTPKNALGFYAKISTWRQNLEKVKVVFFYKINTTGLQPVSRPVEQILVFSIRLINVENLAELN